MTQKDMLILAQESRNRKEELMLQGKYEKISTFGVAWGGSKEDGKVYHAYCEFSKELDGLSHPYRTGFYEDCIQTSRKENEDEARKKGWVIGRGKLNDLAICPLCVERLKNSCLLK